MEEEALKKAYAEMILNTAKEAAARVLAAERETRRFELELVSVKEESSRMLLRSKQLIDSKIVDVEVAKSSQQGKIDELESQLNEAEDVIVDLRAELAQAREQLSERRKLIALRSSRQMENAELTSKIERGGYDLSVPVLESGSQLVTFDGKSLLCGKSSEGGAVNYTGCGPARSTVKVSYSSDVHAGKCATEIGLVNERLTLGDGSGPCNNSTSNEDMSAIGSTSLFEENGRHGRNEAINMFRRSSRKRNLKFWDDVIAACGRRPYHHSKKPSATFSHLSSCKYNKVVEGQNEVQINVETQSEEDCDCVEKHLGTELKRTGSSLENNS